LIDTRYPAVYDQDLGGYYCGYPGCGNAHWTATPTDVFCYNGHAVPDWQVNDLYGDDELDL
jgi:hypothetical protein